MENVIESSAFDYLHYLTMAVPRAYQVDAVELDTECLQLFKGQFRQATAHLPGGFLDKIEPEISALLSTAVHIIPLISSSTLVGHQLLGMKFDGRVSRKWYMYGLAVVCARWFSERWKTISALLLPDTALERADRVMDSVELFVKISSLVNSLLFLKNGLYPTLIHRLLKLNTRLVDPSETKSADLSTLTRELLWHSFAELMMFALPLVNVHRLKRWFSSWKTRTGNEPPSPIHFETNTLCAACNQAPIIPQWIECGHIFCYYCLSANLAADHHYQCPICGCPASS